MAEPSLALVGLSIRNFRGIESLDLNFRGPDGCPNSLVVLAGPNGSGKTAVLEAGLITCGGHRLAVGRRGKRAIRAGAENYTIVAEFMAPFGLLQVEDDAYSSPPSPPFRIPHWYFSSWRAPELVGPVDVTVGRRGAKPRRNDLNRLRNVKQQLVNAAAMERFQSGQQALWSRYTDWMDKINSAWMEFYPDLGSPVAFHVDLRAEPVDENDGAFDLYFEREEGHRITVDDLSAGQLELFLFLAALVLNEDREGIVFIDEPELHLDPQWHRLIIRTLCRLQPQAQFIVATHSPEIYDSARSYERHFLVPENDPRSRLWQSIPDVGSRADAR